LSFHQNLVELGKTLTVALAVGLDTFAISIGVGVAQLAPGASLRVGFAFALAEIMMQVIGYELGASAGQMLGRWAAIAGFILLGIIGILMVRSALRAEGETDFDATTGTGLLMTALSISLDSLGVGVALPAAAIPLVPLLITVSITTTVFTLVGLAFGAILGERYERRAEAVAGTMLVLLACAFGAEQALY
jgi:putative Mn2+ efflux pump MntP